jgi:hypothetical protein
MNKTAVEIVKQYIIETTESSGPGITERAKECLIHLMREDRDVAMGLYDRIEGLKRTGITYVYEPGSIQEDDDLE